MRATKYTCDYCMTEIPEMKGLVNNPLTEFNIIIRTMINNHPEEKKVLELKEICNDCSQKISSRLDLWLTQEIIKKGTSDENS